MGSKLIRGQGIVSMFAACASQGKEEINMSASQGEKEINMSEQQDIHASPIWSVGWRGSDG